MGDYPESIQPLVSGCLSCPLSRNNQRFLSSVNAHSEDLRSSFVAHEGKKELAIDAVGTRSTVDFGSMANGMTHELYKNVSNYRYS